MYAEELQKTRTVRLFRDGQAAISAELSGIIDRLGSSAESWWSRIEKLSNERLLGCFFAARRERLREAARGLGVHHLANLGGCPARQSAADHSGLIFFPPAEMLKT